MGVAPASLFLLYFFLVFFFFVLQHARKFKYKIKKMLGISKKLLECPCIGKRLKYPRISQKNYENTTGGGLDDHLWLKRESRRWSTKIAAVFRPDEAAKMLKKTGFLLYIRVETFLLWFGGLRRPKMGDRMRESIAGERRERV